MPLSCRPAIVTMIVGLAVLTASPSFGTPTPTLAELAEALDAPTIGPRIDIEGPIQLHQAKIEPAPGTAIHQLLAGDRPCGLYVAGPAKLTYRVSDRFSVPVAKRNLKRSGRLEVTTDDQEGLTIVESLNGGLVWNLGLALPLAESEARPPFPKWATGLLEQPLFERPSVLMLTAQGTGVKGAVYALLNGEREVLRLHRDPVGTAIETLSRIGEIDRAYKAHRSRPIALRLADSPVARNWWDRFPGALVATHEDLRIENPKGKKVVVTAITDLQATQNGVALWAVDLMSEVVFDDNDAPTIDVRSVQVDGRAADFLHRDDRLLVALPRPLAQGDTVQVKVIHESDLAWRPGGDNFWSLGTWAWYPQPELNAELATVDLELRVPKALTPFASGEVVERREEGDHAIVRTRLEHPMQFPVLAAGNYRIYSESRDGLTCHVATYATGKEKGAKRLINNFFASAEYYKNLFNIPYPFKEFTIVEINAWGFGQAPPGMIFITKEAFNSHSTSAGRFFSQGLNERYVHEVAHAWWGHVVKMDSLEEQWMTESFASYSAALCLEVMYGGKKGRKTFDNIVESWRAQTAYIGEGGSIYLANFLTPETDNYRDRIARYELLYNKGPLVIHAMRQKLERDMGSEQEGFRAFVAFMRTYLKSFQYRWAPTRHMVDILNQITGKDDWQPWFERYIYGTEMPPVEL